MAACVFRIIGRNVLSYGGRKYTCRYFQSSRTASSKVVHRLTETDFRWFFLYRNQWTDTRLSSRSDQDGRTDWYKRSENRKRAGFRDTPNLYTLYGQQSSLTCQRAPGSLSCKRSSKRSTESIREQTIFPVWIVSCMYTDFPPSYISFSSIVQNKKQKLAIPHFYNISIRIVP